ncbi:MAG: transposase [Methanosarcina sp.]
MVICGSDKTKNGIRLQVSVEFWNKIKLLLPLPKPKKKPGRPREDDWKILSGIFYVLRTADIPQMFAKIQQFFTLSFFLKIAFPIQAYFLEISHTFWSCTFNESF